MFSRYLKWMMRIAAYLFAVLPLAFLAVAQEKLPDGKGKELVERECTKCHGLEGITGSRNSKDRWASIVDDMVSRGASGTDQEIEQIISYLSANFAPAKINVNKATAKEISTALAISEDDATVIVSYRSKNGNFKDVESLKKVPGVDAQRIESRKDRLEF